MEPLDPNVKIPDVRKVISNFVVEAHQTAVDNGFYSVEQNLGNMCSNLHGEVSELWEAYRAGKLNSLCDKSEAMKALGLAPLTSLEEECADIVIRVFDICGYFKVDLANALLNKMKYNKSRKFRHGGKLA